MNSTDGYRIVHDPGEIDERTWRRFVIENEEGNIFQTPEMYMVYINTERYEPVFTAILAENDDIVALMLGARIEEPGRLASKFSNRIVVFGGPLISNRGEDAFLKREQKYGL